MVSTTRSSIIPHSRGNRLVRFGSKALEVINIDSDDNDHNDVVAPSRKNENDPSLATRIFEEWVQHSDVSYHHFDPEEAKAIRSALLQWYRVHRRKLPWRGDPPPYDGSTAGTASSKSNKNGKKGGKDSKQRRGSSSSIKESQGTIDSFFSVKKSKDTSTQDKNPSPTTTTTTTTTTTSPPDWEQQPDSIAVEKDYSVSPYGIWVSEIMLQQTRVEAVIPYWLKWMEAFPTVEALAAATDEQVNARWAGLGFYRRARFLHQGAKTVVEQFDGKLPQTVKDLQSIPGIGRYTAHAIASLAFGQAVPVVDGNVCRVLARLCGIANHIKAPVLKDDYGWTLAEQIVQATSDGEDGSDAGEVNQALMELGATYCAPSGTGIEPEDPLKDFYRSTKIGRGISGIWTDGTPLTKYVRTATEQRDRCPLCDPDGVVTVIEELNRAFTEMNAPTSDDMAKAAHAAIPIAPPKTAKRQEVYAVAALSNQHGEWLMVKRPSKGLLANQWEFPSALVWTSESVAGASKTKKSKTKAGEKRKKPTEAEVPIVDPAVRRETLDNLLAQIYSPMGNVRRQQLPNSLEHIFSHIRHTMWVEEGSIEYDNAAADRLIVELIKGRESRWMSREAMAEVGVTSSVHKIMGAVQASRQGSFGDGSTAKKGKTSRSKPNKKR